MDGGGRVAGPLNRPGAAGGEGAAGLPAGPAAALRSLLKPLFRTRRSRVSVPVEARFPRGLGSALVAGTLAAVSLAGFVGSGRYDAFVVEHGRPQDILARLAGFGVERVTISGISRLYEHEILRAAGIDWRSSVPFLDVVQVRERLMAMPLIASASVRKLYPNEIVIAEVEREPAALWQKNGRIQVISQDGRVVDELKDDRYVGLPLIVGDDSFALEGLNLGTLGDEEKERLCAAARERMLSEYLALLDAAGPLHDRILSGTYVSGRRWTLKLDGVDIRLPEAGPTQALARLVELERKNRILEKDVIAVDLRMSDRVVVRLTEEAAAARAEAQKKTKKGTAT